METSRALSDGFPGFNFFLKISLVDSLVILKTLIVVPTLVLSCSRLNVVEIPWPKTVAAHTFYIQWFSMAREVQFDERVVWLAGFRFKLLLKAIKGNVRYGL